MKIIKWDGKQINKPGIYSHVPLDIYHTQDLFDGPSVSSSDLRLCFAKSPAHFFCQWSGNPECVETSDKDAWIIGRACHHLFLGEAAFGLSFTVSPYPDWKTIGSRQWRDQQQANGMTVLTANMVDQIRGMSRSLSQNSIVKDGALNGLIEHSMCWKHERTGLWLKARPDSIPQTSVDFCDLKIVWSVLEHDLRRGIYDHGYHAQGALIRSAARALLGFKDFTFTLIFVEKTPPYCIRARTLKDHALDLGERQNEYALDRIMHGLRTNEWPGPGGDRDDAEYIELPDYAEKQINDRLEFGL